jgi:pimeloyl-ACP methyl ester carboxylesterase
VKLYLLSGNGSLKSWFDETIPHFQNVEPIPLELPGYGANPSNAFGSMAELADALLDMTEPGQEIFAIGINALVALHALVRRPNHFSKVYLLAPVGAFLEERRFVSLMRKPLVAKFGHFLLSRFPKLFKHKFSSRTWTDAQYGRMGEGYRRCRTFTSYFEFVQGWNATDLFEWIDAPVVLIWGTGDAVLDMKQVAAWDSILPRAQLQICIKPDWEHYPYIDDPEEFAAFMEGRFSPESHLSTQPIELRARTETQTSFPSHTKAGRLQLAALAGLPVPQQKPVRSSEDAKTVAAACDPAKLYAVRSSGANEDHIDHSNAGVNTTFLRVPKTEVEARALDLLRMGLETAVVQEFIEPKVSGVAFVRWVSAEIEWVDGHLEGLVSGTLDPKRVTLSKLGGDWQVGGKGNLPNGFDLQALWAFLQTCIRTFHYAHSDIEWAWDGQQFWMLQIRPVTAYTWRRSLSSANLNEILPAQVSRLMEHAQRRASLSIGRLYGLWDKRNLRDNEPFTQLSDDASYLNLDLFLARFHDWGLPSQMIANEIGGAAPKMAFSILRFLKSIPTFLRMQRRTRKEILRTYSQLQAFDAELATLEAQGNEDALANWFVRYYVFIVRQNMVINACLSSAMGNFLGKPSTVYRSIQGGELKEESGELGGSHPHRIRFESDPASIRANVDAPPLEPFPKWSGVIRFLHRIGFPGLGGKYFEVREWFRDNNMRLFFRLHHAMKGSNWLLPHPGIRTKSGAFWQDGSGLMQQSHGFVIYPGTAEGIVGVDILIVDALEPGHLEDYKKAKAVIARTGGRLSHGATLLREIRKPSAVLPSVLEFEAGVRVRYRDGVLELL